MRAVAHGLERRLGERLHLHEPLVRQPRLDDGVAAVAMTNGVLVRLDLRPAACDFSSVGMIRSRASNRSTPSRSRGHARVGVGAVRHGAVGRHDHRHRQLVPLADLEIVGVVRGRDLHDAGSERRIDVLVGDDRDLDVRRSGAATCLPTRCL